MAIYSIASGVVPIFLWLIATLLHFAAYDSIGGFPILAAGDFVFGFLAAGQFTYGIFAAVRLRLEYSQQAIFYWSFF